MLNENYGITAAHCITPELLKGKKVDYAKAFIGVLELSRKKIDGESREISKMIPHPKFNMTTGVNDIAIIEFDKPVEFTENIKPAHLPVYNEDVFVGEIVTLSGWGKTEGGDYPDSLLYVHLKVLDTETCKEMFERDVESQFLITENHVCVEGIKDSGGVCTGDSGGPLVRKGTSVVVGISSFGSCQVGSLDGFTRIFSYLNWIKCVINEENSMCRHII